MLKLHIIKVKEKGLQKWLQKKRIIFSLNYRGRIVSPKRKEKYAENLLIIVRN